MRRVIILTAVLLAFGTIFCSRTLADQFTFNVNVTTSNVPGFTPFNFNDIVDFTPTGGLAVLYPMAGNLYKADSGTTAIFNSTPNTASLLSLLGAYAPSATAYCESGWYMDYSSGAADIHLQLSSAQSYFDGSVWHYDTYNHELYFTIPITGVGDVQPMTVARVAQMLGSVSGGSWNESVYQSTSSDQFGNNQLSSNSVTYSGQAAFVSVAPEPSWLCVPIIGMLLLMRPIKMAAQG